MTERAKLVFAVVDDVFRLVLGGIFIYAGWEKIQDPAFFATQVAAYRMLPDFCVGLFALILPMVETLAGFALVATRWPREAALLILGLLGMFFVGLTQGIIRDLKISCGCFGDGGADEGSLGAALRRDLVLLVPAVWLSLRPNRWLFRGVPFLLGVLVVLVLAVFGWTYTVGVNSPRGKLRGKFERAAAKDVQAVMTTAKGDVSPEQWTTNFPSALASAREHHQPLIMVMGEKNCHYCQRLDSVLKGPAFKRWLKGTGIYLAEAHLSETNAGVEVKQMQLDFMRAIPHTTKLVYPMMAVYWPQANSNDNVEAVFTGRRGLMPGKRHESLTGELVNVLDRLLKDYLKSRGARPTFEELLGTGTRFVKIQASPDAKAWMEPASGLLEPGAKVTLRVKPKRTGMRLTWYYPDGKPVPHQHATRLEVNDDMPAGTYSFKFKEWKAIKPTAAGTLSAGGR